MAKHKTESDHILDDKLDLARTEIMLEARRWIRRQKSAVVEKLVREHALQLQTKGPKALTKKSIKIIDAD